MAQDLWIKFRASKGEKVALQQEAIDSGYQLSSYIRKRLFIDATGLRIVRRPTPDTQILAKLYGEINKIGSNINQIAKHLNQGQRCILGLDYATRRLIQLADNLETALSGRPEETNP